jgi:hypothetical protein
VAEFYVNGVLALFSTVSGVALPGVHRARKLDHLNPKEFSID